MRVEVAEHTGASRKKYPSHPTSSPTSSRSASPAAAIEVLSAEARSS